MSPDDLRYRLGTGPGGPNIEEGMAWAAANDFHFLDFNADHGPNALGTWDDDRVRKVRQLAEQHDLHLGIHTLPAVNVAEFSLGQLAQFARRPPAGFEYPRADARLWIVAKSRTEGRRCSRLEVAPLPLIYC